MTFKRPEMSDDLLIMQRYWELLKQYCNDPDWFENILKNLKVTVREVNLKRGESITDTVEFLVGQCFFKYGTVGLWLINAAGYELERDRNEINN